MKRMILTAVAALGLSVGLFAAADPAMAQRWDGGGRHGRFDREERGGRWSGQDRNDRWDRNAPGNRVRPREQDGDGDWDSGRHNGYYFNNRWSYGRPPEAYRRAPGFRPGYAAWRRGAYLPDDYRNDVVYDYGRYRLRPPPRGYHWVRVNQDYLLVAIATGLIFDIIFGD